MDYWPEEAAPEGSGTAGSAGAGAGAAAGSGAGAGLSAGAGLVTLSGPGSAGLLGLAFFFKLEWTLGERLGRPWLAP